MGNRKTFIINGLSGLVTEMLASWAPVRLGSPLPAMTVRQFLDEDGPPAVFASIPGDRELRDALERARTSK
jgi:hypothetical protein